MTERAFDSRSGGTWINSRFWFTTEPVDQAPSRWDRLRRFFGSQELRYERKPLPGTIVGDKKHLAEQHHNAALAAGFESELSMIQLPGQRPSWTVNIRRSRDRSPTFWSEELKFLDDLDP